MLSAEIALPVKRLSMHTDRAKETWVPQKNRLDDQLVQNTSIVCQSQGFVLGTEGPVAALTSNLHHFKSNRPSEVTTMRGRQPLRIRYLPLHVGHVNKPIFWLNQRI
jgi:hypothetical protein